MRFLLVAILLLSGIGSFSQKEKEKIDPEKIQFGGVYKTSISISAGGTSSAGGISLEHLLTKRLRLDVGIGYLGVGAGFQYFPWPVKRGTIRPHLNISSTLQSWPGAAGWQAFYGGAGFNWFMIRKFNLNLDIGPAYFYHYWVSPSCGDGAGCPDRFFLMGNIKLGYRFSFYAHKRRKKYIDMSDQP